MAPLRVGLVGLGQIATLHVAAYEALAETRIVAICDADPERLRFWSDRLPGVAQFTDFDRFLDQELDIVEVLTPHPAHEDIVVAALERGANVSVQKPMALTLEACERMQVTAARRSRRLKVFENALYYPPIEEARALLQAGAIGAPLHCRLRTVAGDPRFAWRIDPSSWSWRQALWEQGTAGRLTFDDGHHKMAVALWLFGPVEEVFARIDWGTGPGGAPIDAPATLTWVHRQPRVHVMWDIVHAPRMRIRSHYYALDEVIEITGETGIIRVNRLTGRMLDAPALELYADGRLTGFHDLDSDWSVSFGRSTAAFVDVVLGRADRWRLDGGAAREVLSLALTLEQSARNGSRMSAQSG